MVQRELGVGLGLVMDKLPLVCGGGGVLSDSNTNIVSCKLVASALNGMLRGYADGTFTIFRLILKGNPRNERDFTNF